MDADWSGGIQSFPTEPTDGGRATGSAGRGGLDFFAEERQRPARNLFFHLRPRPVVLEALDAGVRVAGAPRRGEGDADEDGPDRLAGESALRPGDTRRGEPPRRVGHVADAGGHLAGDGLGDGAVFVERLPRDRQFVALGVVGVGDERAVEVVAGAGHVGQERPDEAARTGLRDRDGVVRLAEGVADADLLGRVGCELAHTTDDGRSGQKAVGEATGGVGVAVGTDAAGQKSTGGSETEKYTKPRGVGSDMDIDVEPTERPDADEDDDAGDDGPAEIEVEVTEPDEVTSTDTEDLPEGIDAPDYVLYGGKGGVGKTTMAAATALASAADGTATLVVSTDPAHSLSDTLGVPVPDKPTRIREEIPLYAAEIDPDAVMDGPFAGGDGSGEDFDDETDFETGDYDDDNPFAGGDSDSPFGGMGGGMGGFEDLLGGDGPMGMGGPMPGADEAAAMQQLLEYMDDPRFDRVVVDTAPTGHTLRLLELPELMDSMLGRIARMRQRFSGMMDNLKGMFGGGPDDPQAGMADLDDLRERIERLRAVLRDPTRTDFRVVMIPEEMSVVESKRLVSRLDEFGIPVQTLVVNRVMESVEDVADVDPKWIESPDLENCGFCQRRWQVQQDALRSATNLFRGRDVKRVPLLAEQVQGEDALRVVATCLK